ncbi:MAG: (Fe-S)-binding protein, partial [Longimicrobiales bacterium]
VQDGLFRRANRATVRVLKANGCVIVDAPRQRCCGALHAHSGAIERARELARANIQAFEGARLDRIVVNAAGCGAMMKEYGGLLEDAPAWAERAAAFSARVRDLWELLAELGPATGATLQVRATFDAPCHLHHAQRITRAPLDVLGTIPGLELVPLPDADECCGGAGLYGTLHRELGGRILDDKVAAIRATGAQLVLTPNPGCIMQIGAGLLMAGERTPVLHPVELLDESYRRAGPSA